MTLFLDSRPEVSTCQELALKKQNLVDQFLSRACSYCSMNVTNDSRIQGYGSEISGCISLLQNKITVFFFFSQMCTDAAKIQAKFGGRYPALLLRLNKSCKSSHLLPVIKDNSPASLITVKSLDCWAGMWNVLLS